MFKQLGHRPTNCSVVEREATQRESTHVPWGDVDGTPCFALQYLRRHPSFLLCVSPSFSSGFVTPVCAKLLWWELSFPSLVLMYISNFSFFFFFAVFFCVTSFFRIQSYQKTLFLVKAGSNDAGHRVPHVISVTWLASLIVWLWDQKEKLWFTKKWCWSKFHRSAIWFFFFSLIFFFSLFNAFVCGCHCCAMNLCRLPLLTGLGGS